jgi:hypothetical protein
MTSISPGPCVGSGAVKVAAPGRFWNGASDVASLDRVTPLLSGRMEVTACGPKLVVPV